MAVTKVTVFFYYTKEERKMKSELAEIIDRQIQAKIESYCGDCKYYKGTCTKKIPMRICKKERIKEVK